MSDAHVPVIMALNTRDEMSPRLEGQIEALRGERTKHLCQSAEGGFFQLLLLSY